MITRQSSFVLLAVVCLSGCASVADAPPVLSSAQILAEYRLGSGDKVHVVVFGQDNLSGDFKLDGAGSLAFPLVGEIKAEGKTTHELEQAIDDALRGTYLADPKASVQVVELRPYYILGEVNKPGSYPSIVGLNVTQAVATAEGYTYRANTHRVYVRHAGETQEKLYPVTNTSIVMPGDTIRIPERLF